MISMSEFKEEDKVVFGVRNMEELKRLQSEIDSWNPKVNECFRGLSTVLNFKDKVVTVSSPSGSEYKVHAVVIVRYDAFNEGDVKKVVADLKDLKMLSQGFGEWDDRMVEIIEKEVKIINKKPNGTCKVQYEDNIWTVSPKCFFKEDMKKDSVQPSVQPLDQPSNQPSDRPSVLKSLVKIFTTAFRKSVTAFEKLMQYASDKIQNAYNQLCKRATGTNRNAHNPPERTNVQKLNSNFNEKLVCPFCSTENPATQATCSACFNKIQDVTHEPNNNRLNSFHQSVTRSFYWKCNHCTFWNKPKINYCECCLELKQRYKSGSSGQEEHDEPQEHKSGWKCDECTFFNTFDYSFCDVCGSAGPYFDKWHCDHCTYLNAELNTKCDACNKPNRYLYKCVKCKELAVNIRNLPCSNPVYLICKKCEKEDIYEILDKNNDA